MRDLTPSQLKIVRFERRFGLGAYHRYLMMKTPVVYVTPFPGSGEWQEAEARRLESEYSHSDEPTDERQL